MIVNNINYQSVLLKSEISELSESTESYDLEIGLGGTLFPARKVVITVAPKWREQTTST